MQAFAVIATSPLHIDLSCVLVNLIAELTGFLRKVYGFFATISNCYQFPSTVHDQWKISLNTISGT